MHCLCKITFWKVKIHSTDMKKKFFLYGLAYSLLYIYIYIIINFRLQYVFAILNKTYRYQLNIFVARKIIKVPKITLWRDVENPTKFRIIHKPPDNYMKQQCYENSVINITSLSHSFHETSTNACNKWCETAIVASKKICLIICWL